MRSGERLRIALACPRFPPMTGGTEVHVAKVGARLAARGHDVTVFTTVLDRHEVGETTVDGMNVVRLRAWPPRTDLYLAPKLRRRLIDGGFDIVHVQGYHTLVAPLAMSGALAAGVPFVVTFHSGGHSSAIRRAFRPVQQMLLRRHLSKAARLIGVSDFEGRYFRDRLRLDPARFLTITNGVDDVFALTEIGATAPIVSSVGRLEEYKGHHLVIEAFAKVVSSVPEARLRIIGTGPYEQQLRSLVRRLGVDDTVEFTSVPFGDRESMARLMAESHVVALASSYESQGIVGLEAVASGAGLVVVDGSALADLEKYSDVDVVASDSSCALADAIAARLALPRPTRRPVLPNWDGVTDQVEAVYRDVLST